jgi:Arc/MetJ-type ribon-helix-helix transcriptional regulator
MEVHLTPDQEALVRDAIASGRLNRPEDAVEQALLLWEERERRRVEILASLDAAEADIKAGRFVEYGDDSLPQMAKDLKHEARQLRRGKVSA